MNIPTISRTAKKGFVTGALALVVLLVFVLFLLPQYRTLQSTLAAKEDDQQLLRATTDELTEIDQLINSLNAVSASDKSKLATAVPYGESLQQFLSHMQHLTQKSNLVITSMDVNPVAAGSDGSVTQSQIKKSQLTMSVRGTYGNVYVFMGLLERHVRPVDILSFSMSTLGSGSVGVVGSEDALLTNLTATIYYLDPPPAQPLFPYGKSLDTSVLSTPIFKSLQFPNDSTAVQPTANPFIYRN